MGPALVKQRFKAEAVKWKQRIHRENQEYQHLYLYLNWEKSKTLWWLVYFPPLIPEEWISHNNSQGKSPEVFRKVPCHQLFGLSSTFPDLFSPWTGLSARTHWEWQWLGWPPLLSCRPQCQCRHPCPAEWSSSHLWRKLIYNLQPHGSSSQEDTC